MATEKIILYDSERDIVLEANVSPEDAQRATTDILFATQLLQMVKNQESSDYENDETSIDEEEVTGASYTQSEVSVYRWNPPCVLFLLETFRSMQDSLNSGKLSQKKVWEEIAKQLREKGYDVTGPQCSSKLRSLKKTYKSIEDHNSKSGNDRRTWQFFEIMEEIFAKKAWSDPVAVASSSGLSSKSAESASGGLLNSNKPTIANLLGKRLRQKEEHEKLKNKRHKERMEMDERLVQALEKLADK